MKRSPVLACLEAFLARAPLARTDKLAVLLSYEQLWRSLAIEHGPAAAELITLAWLATEVSHV